MIVKVAAESQLMWAFSNVEPRRRATRIRGMSLLELLVVMVILCLVAAALPLSLQRSTAQRRLLVTTRLLALRLEDMQSRAASSGRPVQLTLEPAGFRTQLVGEESSGLFDWGSGVEVTLRLDARSPTTRSVTMYPDGSSSGGEFSLLSDGRRATVSVSPLNGRVHQSS